MCFFKGLQNNIEGMIRLFVLINLRPVEVYYENMRRLYEMGEKLPDNVTYKNEGEERYKNFVLVKSGNVEFEVSREFDLFNNWYFIKIKVKNVLLFDDVWKFEIPKNIKYDINKKIFELKKENDLYKKNQLKKKHKVYLMDERKKIQDKQNKAYEELVQNYDNPPLSH